MSGESPLAPPPEYTPTPTEVAALVDGVGNLATQVKALAEQQHVDRTTAAGDVAAVRKRQRRDRVFTASLAVALVVIAALSVVALRGRAFQHCINDQNDARNQSTIAFFIAERNKLKGQIAGLNDAKNGHPVDGFTKFNAATQHALDFNNDRLHKLGVEFDKNGDPVVDSNGDPVVDNAPKTCG